MNAVLDINALLGFHQPSTTDLSRKESKRYWHEHVFQLYKLGVEVRNPYPPTWFAHAAIGEAICVLKAILNKEDAEITEKTFADALGGAVPETIGANSEGGS